MTKVARLSGTQAAAAAALRQIHSEETIMPALTKTQLDHLQDLLDQRESVLRSHLQQENAEKEEFVQVASEVPDAGDSSFATLTVDLGNAAVGRDMGELLAIDMARKRMERDEYGDCIQGGSEIPYERLIVQPTAARCAPCQGNYERTHGDAGSRNSL